MKPYPAAVAAVEVLTELQQVSIRHATDHQFDGAVRGEGDALNKPGETNTVYVCRLKLNFKLKCKCILSTAERQLLSGHYKLGQLVSCICLITKLLFLLQVPPPHPGPCGGGISDRGRCGDPVTALPGPGV